MAKKLESFEFRRMSGNRPGFYDEFLDGDVWELTTEDAPNGNASSLESLRGSIAGYVNRNNKEGGKYEDKVLRTQVIHEYDEDGEIDEDPTAGVLVIQLVDMEEE